MKKKLLLILLISCLFSVVIKPIQINAITYSDISGHWAEKEILNMTGNGVIQGYNRQFNPDDYIIRGDIAVIINNLMQYTLVKEDAFNDVKSGYYKDSVLKVNTANVMVGDGNQNFYPLKNITFQEAIKVICTTFQIAPSSNFSSLSFFNNQSTISDWAKDSISAFVREGYLGKNTPYFKNINFKNNITRAEFVYLINQVFDKNINKKQNITNTVFEKGVLITANDISFQKCVLGKVYIAPFVDASTISFDAKTKIAEFIDLSIDLYKELDTKNTTFNYLLSSFSTAFDSQNVDMTTNIILSVNAINGKVVHPKETFSFNSVVGSRTYTNGYKSVNIVSKGKDVLQMGAGVCQVSTTLYNSALLAGLQITARHQNESLVNYVNPGKEAVVVLKNQDMKFKNTYAVPLKIIADFNPKGLITFSIYSPQKIKTSNIEINTYKENGEWVLKQIIGGKTKYVTKSKY